jgi:hypothetical protein
MHAYDYETLSAHILAAVAAQGSIGQRMHAVIDECARQLPHPDWDSLRRIDFDGDLPVLTGWIPDAWRGGAVRTGDQGLWFGLFGTGDEYGTALYDMFAASGPSWDERSAAWRREIVHHELSYLDSIVLAEVCALAHASRNGLGHDAGYPLTLAYGAMAACTALAQEPLPPQLLALRGAAVGYDRGEAIGIGVFDNLRFIQRVRGM